VDIAHKEGINFFDTADRYGSEPGETETIIGNWFASGGGRRERTVIATKV
jgi:NDP-hexose C3-ketoreductase / dTDP-4-oxo-2-deoxy-alpha-D-pentos-2-ene 2,3-reductase